MSVRPTDGIGQTPCSFEHYLVLHLQPVLTSKMQRIAAISEGMLYAVRGRLHHINDGANTPWQKYEERFFQAISKLRGDKFSINFLCK